MTKMKRRKFVTAFLVTHVMGPTDLAYQPWPEMFDTPADMMGLGAEH